MPKKLQKSLQIYLSKLKKPTHPFTSTAKILSGCRHPKTPSFDIDRSGECSEPDNNAATLSDIDTFLFENFKSLYLNDGNKPGKKPAPAGPTRITRKPRNNTLGSKRFFVSTGLSGSLVDEASRLSSTTSSSEEMGLGSGSGSSTTMDGTGAKTTAAAPSNKEDAEEEGEEVPLPDDCIAVLKYSPDPYEDFRQSMQEMIQSRFHHGTKVDWEFMEELLFCYLNLNEKKSYKFILSAFVDLVVILRQNSSRIPATSCRKVQAGERKKKREWYFAGIYSLKLQKKKEKKT